MKRVLYRRTIFAASLCLLFACGGNDSTGGGGDDTPPDAPTLSGEKFVANWGPVTVQPGQENTQCIVVRLGNPTAIKVHQMRNLLSTGSHHLIVYKDDMDTVEQPTPYDCQPFAGALNLTGMVAPMMITQKQVDQLTLPDGVAYTLAANQMVRIEMHFINSTEAPIAATATSEFYAAESASIRDEANILFIGTPDIDIPAGATMDIQTYFTPSRAQLDLTGAKFFAITGHTHHLGTNVTVSTAPSIGGARTPVYAPSPFSWSEPETVTHKPEFVVPAGGGFDIKCSYHNTGTTAAQFGESANDEMCFFWAYYYPSKGAHVCVHSKYMGLDIDICCPDAGASLCSRLQQ